MQEVAFNNSGSEANEAAIKLARYYAYQRGNKHAHIITMDSSWHGRTLATLAATGSDKARKGFEPLPTGFIQVAYNNIDAVRAAGEAGSLGTLLHQMFQRTFSVAKEVRSQTAIGAQSVSMAAAAVRLAERVFGNLDQARTLVRAAWSWPTARPNAPKSWPTASRRAP
ncbi:hypothetical protein G6F50_015863 [Rhizopus delemar]|uniref:Uncharacterized protein n=1 Tax=Rhizopus delemar TaxID=936053 RepID=A0A9P6XVS6_9FUNG|nr:hypothetical protein G6F50_015863 [Rhizopus delemar]